MTCYKRKILAWGIILVMIMNMAPIQVLAIQSNDGNTTEVAQIETGIQIEMATTTSGGLTITGSANAYEYKDNIVRILGNENLIIKNTNPDIAIEDRITVENGVTANITLSGVNIDVSGKGNEVCAMEVFGEANITLADGTKNILKSSSHKAGLQVEGNAAIMIRNEVAGTGSLEAIGGFRGSGIGSGLEGEGGMIQISGGIVRGQGGSDGAGIGGGYSAVEPIVQISGGIVTAQGGTFGAGIGGGHFAAGGRIEISGGVVTANGGDGASIEQGAAGIGGGRNGAGGTIKISGGSVIAQSGPNAGGIGGGYNGSGGTIQISGGTPIIRTGSIQDEKDSWEGIIFRGSNGQVYGKKQTLKQSLTIEEDETLTIGSGITLSIDEGVILTNSGTLINNGALKGDGKLEGTGVFKSEKLIPQHITDISNQVYTGKEIQPDLVLNNVIMGKAFNIDSINIDDWKITYVNNKDVGMATIKLSKEQELTVEKTFKIVQSDTSFGDDGIKIYKDGKEKTDFRYGDEITIKVTPEITNTVPSGKIVSTMGTFKASNENEIALFVSNGEYETQITEFKPIEIGKELTFTVNTTDKTIPATYFTGDTQSIIAKYVGDDNMASHSESVNITLSRIPLSWEVEGKVKDKLYDGTTDTVVEEEPTLSGIINDDRINVKSGTVTFLSPDAGNSIKINVSGYIVDGKDIGYYIVPDGQPNFADASITKADYPIYDKALICDTKYGNNAKVSLNFDSDLKGIEFTTLTITDDENVLVKDSCKIEGDYLVFELVNDITKVGKTARIEIPVTSMNYKDFNIIVIVTVVGEQVPIISARSFVKTYDGIAVTIDDIIKTATLHGNNVDGNWSFKDSGTIKDVSDSGIKTIVFTTSDIGNDIKAEADISIIINKALATVTAEDKNVYVEEQKPDFTFTQTGFVNGEAIKGVKYVESPIVDMSVAGEYNLIPKGGIVSGGDNENYTITYIPGKLNITVDTSELQAAIIDAKDVKKGIVINEGTSESVISGTKFVKQETMTAFEAAIINAEISLSKVITKNQLSAEIITLESAKTIFVNEVKVGTYKRPSSSSSDNSCDSNNSTTTNPNPEKPNIVIPESASSLTGQTLTLNIDSDYEYNMSVKLPKAFVEILVATNISELKLIGGKIQINLDSEALEKVKEQMGEYVILKANEVAEITLKEDASTIIGTRPVYEISIINNDEKLITKLNGGRVTIGVVYELKVNEKVENLIGYSIDESGEISQRLSSFYDEKEKIFNVVVDNLCMIEIGYPEERVFFIDIKNHWAKDDIEFVATRGLFGGTSTATFSPNQSMARGMFVTVLGRLAQINTEDYLTTQFTDISQDEYYAPYVEWANVSGIASGTTDTTFSPNSNITREQMAVMLYNYSQKIGLKLPDVNKEQSFADNGVISPWATKAVKEMQEAGILGGKSGNMFDPQGTATRAEVATMIRRFVELKERYIF